LTGINGKVSIYKEGQSKTWEKVFSYEDHKSTPLSIAFNQKRTNSILRLLIGYADGFISLVSYQNENWEVTSIKAHSLSVNTVVWLNSNLGLIQFISGGNDGQIKQWSIGNNEKIEKGDVIEKVHESPIKSIEMIVTSSEEKQNEFISYDSDDNVFLWHSETDLTGSSLFKSEQVIFTQEQLPSLITHISYKEPGLITVSSQEQTFLYKKFDKEYFIISASNSDGTIVNSEY
jgi:hypothetical protein